MNQTPKYSIGQEVYVVGICKIEKTVIEEYQDNGLYRLQNRSFSEEDNIYATKEDIIKDLP